MLVEVLIVELFLVVEVDGWILLKMIFFRIF